jgi:hypothetical protein
LLSNSTIHLKLRDHLPLSSWRRQAQDMLSARDCTVKIFLG